MPRLGRGQAAMSGSEDCYESIALDIGAGPSTLFLIKSSALEAEPGEAAGSGQRAEGRQPVRAVQTQAVTAEKGTPAMTTSNEPRYIRPGRSTNVFNETVAA